MKIPAPPLSPVLANLFHEPLFLLTIIIMITVSLTVSLKAVLLMRISGFGKITYLTSF